MRLSFAPRWLTIAVVVLLVAAAVFALWPRSKTRDITVLFGQVVGLYQGDQVRVLGVPVGTVHSIESKPDAVHVTLSINNDVRIPEQAKAAIIAPSLVSGRYVQLAPAYIGGPQLPEGATIPLARTATPVEWDQIKQQLAKVSTDLGPTTQGANGPVTNLLDTTSANLSGQGQNLNTAIHDLSQAMSTLSDGRDDLFGTVRNLQTFTSALSSSDDVVRQFGALLASVSSTLDSDRQDLGTSLATLQKAMPIVQGFAARNGGSLAMNVAGLGQVADALAGQGQNLADILQLAPTTLANFYNINDPIAGSATGELTSNNFADPAQFLCSAMFSLGGTQSQCEAVLAPVAQFVKTNSLPVGVTPVQRPGTSNKQQDTPQGRSSQQQPPPPSSGPGSLGGLLLPGGGR